ncbi:MAG: PDZ domain-containing protein [Gemmatimonas sp.]|nr:PDZ domain-containing protein [Gemmatimonas sp.]
MRRITRKMALPIVLVSGVAASATVMQTMDAPIQALDAQSAAATLPGPEMLASSFRTASQEALKGVVHVQVEAAPRQASRQAPFEGTPFEGTPFEDFFRGQPMPSPSPRNGSGSGFIISPDGYVMTNNHVVENASRVTVTLTDRRQFEAKVVGRDPNTDVAVVKIEGDNLPTVRFGDSDALAVGDWVLALGYPLSLGETVTAGIVSAMGRNIGIMQRNDEAAAPLEHFIQTDAAINPGNSGGPLVNLRGEAIGMNTAIASPTGTYSGYGFAVPITLAKRVADDLIEYGAVHRPRLGIQITDVVPADQEVFGLADANGAVVRNVQAGPAQEAGVELGDVIVAVDGQPIRDLSDLMERVALRQPGERVALDVVRYGKRERLTVTLGAFESPPVAEPEAPATTPDAVSQLGFAAAELTPALASQLRIEGTGGIIITEVDPAGSAPRGLAGMRVERVNGSEIDSVEALREVASQLGPGSTVSVIGLTPAGERTIVNYKLPG